MSTPYRFVAITNLVNINRVFVIMPRPTVEPQNDNDYNSQLRVLSMRHLSREKEMSPGLGHICSKRQRGTGELCLKHI